MWPAFGCVGIRRQAPRSRRAPERAAKPSADGSFAHGTALGVKTPVSCNSHLCPHGSTAQRAEPLPPRTPAVLCPFSLSPDTFPVPLVPSALRVPGVGSLQPLPLCCACSLGTDFLKGGACCSQAAVPQCLRLHFLSALAHLRLGSRGPLYS